MQSTEYRAVAVALSIILLVGILLLGPGRTMFLSPDERHEAELTAIRDDGDLDSMRQLAEAGDAAAQSMLARMLSTRNQTQEALTWYLLLAEGGQGDAMMTVGDWYSRGHLDVVAQNPETATYWYRRAAVIGRADGQYQYGLALMDGNGVEPDEVEAVAWLTAAARQRDRSAMVALAAAYREGSGVERSLVEAYGLYAASLRLSDKDFGDGDFERLQLAELEPEMTTAEITTANARADEWLRP